MKRTDKNVRVGVLSRKGLQKMPSYSLPFRYCSFRTEGCSFSAFQEMELGVYLNIGSEKHKSINSPLHWQDFSHGMP